MGKGTSKYFSRDRDTWYVCDFETITPATKYYLETGDTKVNLACATKFDFYVPNKPFTPEFLGITIESFIEWVKSKNHSMTLFFHNLTFDGDFIIKYLVNVLGVEYIVPEPKKFKSGIAMFKQKNTNYYFKWSFWNKNKKINIYFRCTLKLLSASISALGGSMGISKHGEGEKTELDYEPFNSLDEVPQAFMGYIKRDTMIASNAAYNLNSAIQDIDLVKEKANRIPEQVFNKNGTPKMNKGNPVYKNKPYKFETFNNLTIGGIGEQLQKNYFIPDFKRKNPQYMEVDFMFHKTEIEALWMSNFITGGWTQYNPEFQNNNLVKFEGCVVDISSSYPTQMVKDLPYGPLVIVKPKTGTYIEFMEIKVKKATIKPYCAHMRTLKNWKRKAGQVRYVGKLENFTCYYIRDEWELLNTFYDFEVENTISKYKSSVPFLKDYIDTIYGLKNEAGIRGDEGARLCYKILLNAGYGKFVQRHEFDTTHYDKFEYLKGDTIRIETTYSKTGFKEYKVERQTNSYKISDKLNCYILSDVESSTKFRNSAVGVVVLARARIQLWEGIIEVGIDKWVYSDTDSSAFTTRDMKNLKVVKKGDIPKLGEWEIEKEIDSFKTLGAKRYIAYNNGSAVKSAFAGVQLTKRHINDMDFNDDETHIEGAGLVKTYVKSGIILEQENKTIKKGTQ